MHLTPTEQLFIHALRLMDRQPTAAEELALLHGRIDELEEYIGQQQVVLDELHNLLATGGSLLHAIHGWWEEHGESPMPPDAWLRDYGPVLPGLESFFRQIRTAA